MSNYEINIYIKTVINSIGRIHEVQQCDETNLKSYVDELSSPVRNGFAIPYRSGTRGTSHHILFMKSNINIK